MKYLILLALFLTACKKEKNTITYILSKGAGDVVITDGELVTDFQSCPSGWSLTREAQPKKRYTIWTNARKLHQVQIKYNGMLVASDSTFAVYTTP